MDGSHLSQQSQGWDCHFLTHSYLSLHEGHWGKKSHSRAAVGSWSRLRTCRTWPVNGLLPGQRGFVRHMTSIPPSPKGPLWASFTTSMAVWGCRGSLKDLEWTADDQTAFWPVMWWIQSELWPLGLISAACLWGSYETNPCLQCQTRKRR